MALLKKEIDKEELEKKIMDALVKLYSDQMGCEYTYRKKENEKGLSH